MPVPDDIQDLLHKVRKGTVASLNASKWAKVFEHLPGWTMEKSIVVRPSEGGWFINDVPGAKKFFKSYTKDGDVRRMFKASVNLAGHKWYNEDHRAKDQAALVMLRDEVYPEIRALMEQGRQKPKAKWRIEDLRIEEKVLDDRHTVDVSFLFFVRMNALRITAPDGQEFEVFGDYRNGAFNATTFQHFWEWAVENTDIVEQACTVLGVDPLPPKEDAEAPYVPPATAHEDVLKVWRELQAATEPLTAELARVIEGDLVTGVEAWLEAGLEGNAKRAASIENGSARLVISRHAVRDRGRMVLGTLEGDWKATAAALAWEAADDMRRGYVGRNVKKLSSILSAKGNMWDFTPLLLKADAGMLTGTLQFQFKDGASFRARTAAVGAYAPVSGYWFYRYPVTFHDVVMPDGTEMTKASEQEMNEIFATAVDVAPVVEDVDPSPSP